MKKWLKIVLVTLLVLVVLSGVGAAGYRLGLTQNAEVIQKMADLRAQRMEQYQKINPNGQQIQPNPQMYPRGQGMKPGNGFERGYNPHNVGPGLNRGFDRGFNRGRGGFFPFFGLVKLLILGALLWFGYKYVKNSGWKLVKETPASAQENQEN